MKKVIQKFFILLLVSTSFLSMVMSVSAQNAAVHYDGNAQKFIFEPGSSHSLTDLFAGFKGVMPGDSLTQTIQVKNDVGNRVKVKLYLRSLGAEEKSQQFLSEMKLTVSPDQKTKLFDAPADQTAGLNDWVCLGTFYSGAEMDLNVTLNVPVTMENRFQDAVGKLEWQFKAEELPIEPTDPIPETGDTSIVRQLAAVCSISAGLMLILMVTKKKNKGWNRANPGKSE